MQVCPPTHCWRGPGKPCCLSDGSDTKTKTAGGQLLDMLLIREAIGPDLVKKWASGEAGGDRCGHDRGHHPHNLYLEDPYLSQSRSFPTFGTHWPRSSVLASSAALFRSMLSKIPPISFPPIQWSADWLLQHTLRFKPSGWRLLVIGLEQDGN